MKRLTQDQKYALLIMGWAIGMYLFGLILPFIL